MCMRFVAHRLVVPAALALAAAGCGEAVSFSVLRAARVNVKGIAGEGKDATVSLGEWSGAETSAVEDMKQRIGELITNAEGGVVKLSTTAGIVRVDGDVSVHSYNEQTRSEKATCTRTVGEGKNAKQESYSCTHYTRTGTAKLRASAKVVDGTGKVVGSDSYSDEAQQSTNATDNDPPPIDGDALLTQMRVAGAAKLAALVIPHRVTVTKRWFKCGDANDTCAGGLVQLRSGNFAGAKEQFTKALDQLRGLPKQDPEAMAAAWWGIVLANEFAGDYPAARTALDEAVKLNPKEEVFAAEGQSIAAEEKNAQQLAKQGVGGE